MYYNNYGNNRDGYGKPGGNQSQPSYTKEHPIFAVWFTNGADDDLVEYAKQAGKDLAVTIQQ